MLSTRGHRVRVLALLFLVGIPAFATAQPGPAGARPSPKLDRILVARARQLTGRSRVIVEFHGQPDVRAITSARGVTTRALPGQRAHAAEIGNTDLVTLAGDPRVARVMADRPVFATLERTNVFADEATGEPRLERSRAAARALRGLRAARIAL